MSKIIAVTSGKGGVGKSTVCVGLGQAFAKRHKRVIMIELDIGLRGMDIMLGVENEVVYDLGDLLNRHCDINDAIVSAEKYPGLDMIASPSSVADLLHVNDIAVLCKGLRQYYDVILLDTPAGIHLSIDLIPQIVDLAVIVATPDYVSVRDSNRMVSLLTERNFDRYQLVINKVNIKNRRMNMISDLDDVMDGVGIPLLGVIPEDVQMKAAVNGSLNPESGSAPEIIFHNIAARIEGEYIPLYIE